MTRSKSPLLVCIAACALALGCALPVLADEAPRTGEDAPREGHHPPPPEALEACKAKKAADPCNFKAPQADVSGQCFAPPDKPLACRPAHPPRPDDAAPRRPDTGLR